MSRFSSKDPLGGLGVGPDVELGRGRSVPFADRPAHQDDPPGSRPGVGRERETDIRQWAGRDERCPWCRTELLGEVLDRVLVLRSLARRRQVGTVETGLLVHVRCDVTSADERRVGARVDGNVAASGCSSTRWAFAVVLSSV